MRLPCVCFPRRGLDSAPSCGKLSDDGDEGTFYVTQQATQTSDTGRRLPLLTRFAYGFGSVAYGVKDNAFGFFLILFYGTVIGIDERLVGLALLITLLFDAISDPIVGYISDNWRSKWGRRHPFMYIAVIPVTVSFFFLWNPPDWPKEDLFVYMLVLALLIRTFITFYETPSSALLPELAADYDERASVQAFRNTLGWIGGNAMTLIGFGVIFVSTPEFEDGQLNREAYISFGLLGSGLIFIAILVSSLGTHGRIKTFQSPPPRRKLGLKGIFGEIAETLGNKSFFALFVATLFGGIAAGVSFAMTLLIATFFWEFSPEEIFLQAVAVMGSALIAGFTAPAFVRWLGKKRAVLTLGALAFGIAPLPVMLRLLGVMPENGDPLLFPIIVTIILFDTALIIASQIVLYSMIADLVEVSELKTGRRSEGVFYAAVTFIRKSAQGFGALAAGFILAFANMPDDPQPGEVTADALFRMGLGYAPTLWVLWSLMLIAIGFYRIDRKDHQQNLEELARRKADARI